MFMALLEPYHLTICKQKTVQHRLFQAPVLIEREPGQQKRMVAW